LVEVLLILAEEWFEIRLVNPGGTLGLREGEEEQEESLDFPVERKPADEPFADILDSDENADGAPVHGKILEGI